jgi:hypothetical protein
MRISRHAARCSDQGCGRRCRGVDRSRQPRRRRLRFSQIRVGEPSKNCRQNAVLAGHRGRRCAGTDQRAKGVGVDRAVLVRVPPAAQRSAPNCKTSVDRNCFRFDLGRSPIKPATARISGRMRRTIRSSSMRRRIWKPTTGGRAVNFCPALGKAPGCCDRVVVLVRTGPVTDCPSGALCRNP